MALDIESILQAFSVLNPFLLVVMVAGSIAAMQYHYNHTGRKKASNLLIPASTVWALGWANYIINKFSPFCLPMTVACCIAIAILSAIMIKQARTAEAKANEERSATSASKQGTTRPGPVKPKPTYRQQPRLYNARYQSHKKYLQPRRRSAPQHSYSFYSSF